MRLITVVRSRVKEVCVILCVILIFYHIPKADSLNCFSKDGSGQPMTRVDCQMHTGCLKKSDPKSRKTLEKGCYLTPGTNDTCFLDDEGLEICWCHTDYCNAATKTSSVTKSNFVVKLSSAILLPALARLLVTQ